MKLAEKLADEIEGAVRRSVGDSEKAAVLFSGGVDSGLLAHIARGHCDVSLYVVGFPGSPDIEWAGEAAGLLEMPVNKIPISEDDIETAIGRILNDVGMQRVEWLTPLIPLYLAMSGAEEEKVLCGQGADELFGGYRKYREGVEPRFAEMLMARDLESLISEEIPYYHKMAAVLGKKAAFPFLDDRLLSHGLGLPYEVLVGDDDGKLALREAARFLGLPEEISGRPKKAVQYGTYVSREIKKIAKSRGRTLEDYIQSYIEY